MSRLLIDEDNLKGFLEPETPLEALLIDLPAFQKGLLWGEPRYGHPEGKVALHVKEVFSNINRLSGLAQKEREQLRLIALAHDTFKYQEDRARPRNWEKHHARLARKFMEAYCQDRVVLEIIETHDDAYYSWLSMKQIQQGFDSNYCSLDKLLQRVGDFLQLYYMFFRCDTLTGDKNLAPLKWFEQTVFGEPDKNALSG
jgi:HD domain